MKRRKVKFLADENIEYRIVTHLREKGYDILAITESFVSMNDEKILQKAYLEDRVLLTNDKDFGDLIFLQKLHHKGIILFRFKSENLLDKIHVFDVLLKNYQEKLMNKFVVIGDSQIKIRS